MNSASLFLSPDRMVFNMYTKERVSFFYKIRDVSGFLTLFKLCKDKNANLSVADKQNRWYKTRGKSTHFKNIAGFGRKKRYLLYLSPARDIMPLKIFLAMIMAKALAKDMDALKSEK